MKITVVLLVLGALLLVGCQQEAVLIGEATSGADLPAATSLGTCLTEQGAVMYGAEWCGHCQNQKKAFGDDWANVNFVDCELDRVACTEAGIRGYPTWKINGQDYMGEQSLEKLASLTGCD